MTKTIQVCGVEATKDDITPFVSDEMANQYGVYIGRPGDFVWAADFAEKAHAQAFVRTMADSHGYEIDDMTFKEY